MIGFYEWARQFPFIPAGHRAATLDISRGTLIMGTLTEKG
jgi:hypothetical protein